MMIQTKKIIVPLPNWICQQLIRITDLYETPQNYKVVYAIPLVGTLNRNYRDHIEITKASN